FLELQQGWALASCSGQAVLKPKVQGGVGLPPRPAVPAAPAAPSVPGYRTQTARPVSFPAFCQDGRPALGFGRGTCHAEASPKCPQRCLAKGPRCLTTLLMGVGGREGPLEQNLGLFSTPVPVPGLMLCTQKPSHPRQSSQGPRVRLGQLHTWKQTGKAATD
ncbi:hypothetical protein P7K49_022763, partial [Saguinus oedipus]